MLNLREEFDALEEAYALCNESIDKIHDDGVEEFWERVDKLERDLKLTHESRDYYIRHYQNMARKAREEKGENDKLVGKLFTVSAELAQRDFDLDAASAGLKRATKVINKIRRAVTD